MDKRIAQALMAGTVMALPLLTACGASTAPAGSSAAPAASSAAAAPSTTAAATPSATPTSDPAQETAAVKAASEKFVKAGLTIGYPDKHVDDYTGRLKPLMTPKGYKSLVSVTGAKKADQTLEGLYAQHARTTPEIKSEKVSSLTADAAQVKVSYQSQYQQKSGGDWKTAKTDPTETVALKLVHEGDSWLVDDLP
ncbi:MAG: hypothetical protein ACRYG2_13685 [Janthinobacterium lividum]